MLVDDGLPHSQRHIMDNNLIPSRFFSAEIVSIG